MKMIEIKHLNIEYDGISYIEKDNMSIQNGSFIGIYGESGTGKTSFLNFLSFKKPFGKLILDGVDIYQLDEKTRQSKMLNNISYISQTVEFVAGLNLRDILILSGHLVGRHLSNNEVEDIKEIVGLKEVDSNVYPYQLSGGQRQLLAIAESFIKDVKIVIYDEITNGLDEEISKKIISLLRNIAHTNGNIVLMVMHQQKYINEFDHILLFENNTILCDEQEHREPTEFHPIQEENKGESPLLVKAYFKSSKKSKRLFFILMILAIAFSSVGYKYCFQVINHIKNLQSMIESNSYYVLNDTLFEFEGVPMYVPSNLHFTANQVNQISHMDGVIESYPVLTFAQLEGYHSIDKGWVKEEDCFVYKVSDQEEPINLKENISPMVFAYKDQEYYDLQCASNVNSNGSIYITKRLANSLNIKEIKEGMTLTYTALVPIELNSTNRTVEGVTKEVEEAVYKKVLFEYEIRGILNPYFQNLFANDIVYMNDEEMDNILNQYQSSWQANTYVIKTSSDVKQSELKNDLRKLDSHFNLLDPSENITHTFASILKPTQVTQVVFYMMMVIVIGLGLTYSYMQSKTIHDFMRPLFFRGVSKKILNKLLIKAMIMEIAVLTVMTLLLTNILYKVGVSMNILVQASQSYQEWLKVNGLAVVLSIGIIVLTYGVAFFKGVLGKEND